MKGVRRAPTNTRRIAIAREREMSLTSQKRTRGKDSPIGPETDEPFFLLVFPRLPCQPLLVVEISVSFIQIRRRRILHSVPVVGGGDGASRRSCSSRRRVRRVRGRSVEARRIGDELVKFS